MIEPRRLTGVIDSRDSFQAGFATQGNGFVRTPKMFRDEPGFNAAEKCRGRQRRAPAGLGVQEPANRNSIPTNNG